MKTTLRLFLACLGIMTLFTFSTNAQRAKDGDYTVTAANEIVNTYTFLTASPGAGNTITVNDPAMLGGVFGGALAQGDLILIIQMYGSNNAATDVGINTWPTVGGWGPYTAPMSWWVPGPVGFNTESFGDIISYDNVGRFEQREVESVAGNVITLTCDLENSGYDFADRVQVVRIPRFDNLTINAGASIVPTAWNGSSGGIVGLEVESVFDINATGAVSASGFGFRGGELDPNGQSGNSGLDFEDKFLGSNSDIEGSERGESVFGWHAEYDFIESRYGKGAIANGGAGGAYQNCGGGGGSNIQIGGPAYNGQGNPVGFPAVWALDPAVSTSSGGGRGGYAISNLPADPTVFGPNNFAWGEDNRKNNGGWGGHPLVYDPDRLFFGGGGGAGDQDSDEGGAGGAGGGLVFIVSYGTMTGSGTVEANGAPGQNTNFLNLPADVGNPRRGIDGAGGGGGGGSIYVENAAAIPASLNFDAEGGDGGDQNITLFDPGAPFPAPLEEASGPGGSGSGGSIAFTLGAPTQSVITGVNGVTDSPQMALFPPNGATTGSSGEASLPAPFYDLIPTGATICAGQTANISVAISGALPAGSVVGDITWFTSQYGNTPVPNTGLTFTTPALAVTTTYYVGLCPGTFRVPVIVTVSAGANLVTTDPAPLCAPATADITLPAVTAGSDAGALTYWQDNGATIVEPAPTTVGAGWHYIQLDIGGGCTALDSVLVTIDPAQDPSFTLTPTCEGVAAVVTGTPGGTFTFNPDPGDGAIINATTGAVTNGVLGTTYFVEYLTPGPCPDSLTLSATAATDLAYTPTLTNEACGLGDGVIDLVGTGGTGAPYQYSITGGAPYSGSGNFTGLSAGPYNISVLDASGCEVTGVEVLTTSGAPSIDVVAVTDPSCAGACDGSITLTVSGGTPPYSYQWYDNLLNPIGTDSPTLSGQCAGDFSVDVTDASGGSTTYFSEDFGNDVVACSSQGTLASGYNSGVGAWTTTATGVNAAEANKWFVSTMEAGVGGTGPGFCSDGCGISVGLTDRTLHMSNEAVPALLLAADQGAAYNNGGACGVFYCVETDMRAESPAINLAGTNMTLTFDYIHESDGTDECELMYYDGGAWNSLGVLPNTAVGGCGLGQHEWAQYSWPIPLALNGVPNFQLGFRWYNNDDGAGIDPSVAIDNIQITEPGVACPANALATLTDPPAPVLVTTDPAPVCAPNTVDITLPAVTAGSDAGALTYWQDNGATIVEAAPTTVGTGWHYIQLDVAGCTVIDSVQVVVNPLDDASFTSVDFCESTVNVISAVAIPGGVYSITSQTGSGLATINAGTGILANFVAGDQVTIQYTTPAGGCQNTSTQVVNVLPNDDASFTTLDFCESSVNVVSAVAIPGGTFAITSQTGSGLVTINAGTGILANYVAGDQVTIEYTTPAGGCQNTSTQVVNITALDDASFTTVDFCVSSVNVISAVAVPGGTYAITAQTGSGLVTINAGTGILSNYVAGDQVTIEYTTPAGGCQNTSTQVVNVTNLDDASFTSVDFCESAVNVISAVATVGGTYAITAQTGSGLATINAGTGVLANFVAGDQITIEYTTPAGGCQNTSTQIVNVTPLDDASFTSLDFCVSTVNTVSAVAVPGGVYSITSQTGSGLATINAGTGVLANFVAGDQVTIQYTTPAGGCQNTSTQVVNVTALDDASFTSVDFCESTVNVISAVATPGGTYAITAQTGSGLATITAGTGVLANFVAGDQVTIEYTTNGACPNTSTQIVNVTPLDDASFTSVDFCESAVNVISAVAIPGGVYSITSQTGSGLATINAGTGVLSNFVAGDQITIEYTTPAGGCQNTSTQIVNVTPLDDASFTSVDFCESSVNVISAVATPGGTYAITAQTGSGLVTITAGTGVLANYVAGDQVTIEYTTNGTCPNTSTQVVNVTALDDASFTSVDFCESATNVISAVANPGGSYAITAQTGSGLATITAGTGVLANFVAGDQITIEYTTPAGACQNTSTQIVNVLPADDASFTSVDFCESATNVISAVAIPGGTYAITAQTGSGLATIDLNTGVLANFVAGDQITIEYTTPAGGCQNTSTQVVNVTALDDASFTTVDFCESTVNTISAVATPGGTFAITAQTGSGLATIDLNTGVLANFVAGDQVTIEYTTNGACPNTSTQVVNVTALDDASFTSVDFCESAVNVISAVAIPGGTFVITVQTGSGLATIDGNTGVLANFLAGDQITIEYTTPAGGCQNTSTQVVNVTPLDDASFTSVDFCENAMNVISAVAIPGGTYAITAQTGSGLATIDGNTGVLANFVAGDQITIEYTTPAGGCQNTSTQVVNVTPMDDASFTTLDFCEASVNVISAVAIPGGTYVITSQTGSGLVTIDGTTGILSNYAAGDQVTIEYTTPAGGCQNTSTQIVNVTAQDDASFTSVDFCESSVNTISAVAVPGGTYAITAQTGTASIDGNTGVLSGFVAGDQITIEYTTPAGACQNTSTQVVNVLAADDGSFTMTQTCDGGTAIVTGLAGGTFTFTSAPTDAAIIDGATGTVSGGTNSATYDVTYTTNGACPVSVQQLVTALDLDDATFALAPTCDGAIATVSGTTGGTFTFSSPPTDAAIIDVNTGDVTGGDFNSTYSIEYLTAGACPTSSIETVTVNDCSVSIDIVIPTAFTPGIDGINDTWEIQDLDNNYPDNIVMVYNRWGNVVFEYSSSVTNPYSLNEWDGTYKGQALPVASYYYVIDANDGSGETFKGTVTIVKN